MKILAASDIHGNHETYRWLVSMARIHGVDRVTLAGDLLGLAEGFESVEEAQREDAARIRTILDDLPVPLYYIMGNDDWVDLQPPRRDAFWLHGLRLDGGEFNFVGYQFTLPFMGGVNERQEAEIRSDLRELEHLMDERTILVTHGPAAGILDAEVVGPVGSASLAEVIERRKVRAHIHGHTHRAFGREQHHFNVAAGLTRRAMIIDVASMEHEVLT